VTTRTNDLAALVSTPEIQAWTRLLRTHAALTRRLNADLVASHGLTLNDYDVLLQLAHAPDRRLKRVDLADRVLLTPSGITRLLAGLERAGLVERADCPEDARVSYAQLTDAGLDSLRDASSGHLASVRELFADRFSADELETLTELLTRLPAFGVESCSVPDEA
jgi:DNA-binding MarR family transcriptional regulator